MENKIPLHKSVRLLRFNLLCSISSKVVQKADFMIGNETHEVLVKDFLRVLFLYDIPIH